MNIYVGNLNYQATEDDLRPVFEEYGAVSSVKVIFDRETQRSRGFAFVEMPEAAEGQAAIEGLNDKEVLGRKLRVSEAQNKRK